MAKHDTKTALGTAKGYGAATMPTAIGGYKDFAATGGVTPEEQNLARTQTSYGISSLFDALKRNRGQRKRVQGGYAPGYDASNRAMTRDTASTTGRAITGTNLGLLDMIRQGRIAGLGGLSNIGMGSLGIQSGLATQPGWGSSV